jgi:hypothetical protein
MARAKAKGDPVQAIRALALAYPEVATIVVCERSAFKARGKSFLFLGEREGEYDLMLKLEGSLDEARLLAKKSPRNYSVGGHNWVTLTFAAGKSPPAALLKDWIDESFRLLAPKSLVAKL